MIRLLALILAAAAAPVFALSCTTVDVAWSYQNAADSEKRYVVLLGQFSFDETALPYKQHEVPQSALIETEFSGVSLSKKGFETPFSGLVTLNAECFGPFCSTLQSGLETLAFVEKTNDGYVLTTSPCGGFAYQNPIQAQIEMVVSCHNGRSCTSAF